MPPGLLTVVLLEATRDAHILIPCSLEPRVISSSREFTTPFKSESVAASAAHCRPATMPCSRNVSTGVRLRLNRCAMSWRRSPIRYVERIRTPLLLTHGEMDLRCAVSQAEELFGALRLLGREVELVRFPGESP